MPEPDIDKQSKSKKSKYGNPAWVPGVSGNPAGRPKKGSAIADILNAIGEEIQKDGISKKTAVLKRVYGAALDGNMDCVKFIADRIEGKPVERHADVSEEWKDVLRECAVLPDQQK